MRFKSRRLKIIGGEYVDAVALVNFVFLVFLFVLVVSNYAGGSETGIKVDLPKAVTSTTAAEGSAVISITRERLVYFAGKVVSLKELASKLQTVSRKDSILIKADKGTSLERVVEVWDICRNAGISQVNIATTQAK